MTEQVKSTDYVVALRVELDVMHDALQSGDALKALAIATKLKNRVNEDKPVVDWIDEQITAVLDTAAVGAAALRAIHPQLCRVARLACLRVSMGTMEFDDTELQTRLKVLCEVLERGLYGNTPDPEGEEPLVKRINVQLRRLHTEIAETHSLLDKECSASSVEPTEGLSLVSRVRSLVGRAVQEAFQEGRKSAGEGPAVTSYAVDKDGVLTRATIYDPKVSGTYQMLTEREAGRLDAAKHDGEVTSLYGTVAISGPKEDVADVVKYLPTVEGTEQPHSNYERFGDDDPDWLPIHQFLGLLDGSGASEDWQGVEQFFMAWGMTVDQWARLTDNLRLNIDNASVIADTSHDPVNFTSDLKEYHREVSSLRRAYQGAPVDSDVGAETAKRMIDYVTNLHRTIYALHGQLQTASAPDFTAATVKNAARLTEIFANWITGDHTEEVREAARRALVHALGMSEQAAADTVSAADPNRNPVYKNRFIADVIKFNLAAGRTIDTFNTRQLALHTGLECEELAETLDALAMNTRLAGSPYFTLYQTTTVLKHLGDEFKKGSLDALFANADPRELLDGAIDRIVVSIGSIMSQGADIFGAMGHVAERNLAKLVNGVAVKDANGKIQKPEGWAKPNLMPFLHPSKQPSIDHDAFE